MGCSTLLLTMKSPSRNSIIHLLLRNVNSIQIITRIPFRNTNGFGLKPVLTYNIDTFILSGIRSVIHA